jgi:2,3-bisphosphoglycerate-independent phosphoglycerate mutase
MDCVPIDLQGTGERTAAKIAAYAAHAAAQDFLYFHVKKIDSAGEDGDFAKKVGEIEAFDAIVPQLLAASPDVVVITGDHSTPVPLKAHSWHPLPVLIWSRFARPDRRRFTEDDCRGGSLGSLRHLDLLPLALANAGKLNKYGA